MVVEKPWGRPRLPAPFTAAANQCIGEVWYQSPSERLPLSLLVKYLFTSENLSIQVHPDDNHARARGLAGGKEECWYILNAEPGALLGIGTIRPLPAADLREAAEMGELPQLMQWHSAKPGMLFHIPPGTIHAIGAGITLIEVQQNRDITYRLYDYGRARELHLIDGSEVADAQPFPPAQQTFVDPHRSAILLKTSCFTIAQITDDHRSLPIGPHREIFVIPLAGQVSIDGLTATPGDCVLLRCEPTIRLKTGSRALLAWSG